ncbi:MAG: methionyl-tRNA formyltransferase, partial [Bacteroidetes bacterium]|nr:methionyl-tRNA formyltransferase [Bacteroidota bacterium]
MKSLKIVFFGTPEFAKVSLDAIYKSNHQVVGVVTVADKPVGRGQKISQSPVKSYALENNLPLYQPEKLRSSEFLDEMKELQADLFVVVAFRMMPKLLFEMPRLGTFNLHGSLLPDYRGAAPINFAIINGEEKTGVTTFFINEKIDEGNLLLQAELPISNDENAGSLHDRLMVLGAELVVKTIDGLAENSLTELPQPNVENPKNAFKIFKEDTEINWSLPSKKIYDFVRGMSPYPCAYTTISIGDEKKSLKIFSGKYDKLDNPKSLGKLEFSKNEMKIYTTDGVFFPLEVQLEGKKRMDIKSFLNGFQK